MNRLLAFLIAGIFALLILGGIGLAVGGGLLGAVMFVIGLPLAFPMTTSLIALFFAIILIRAGRAKYRKRHQYRAFDDDDPD
ncbi:hypothetical protein [Thalassospira sp.]|uniref:hypothetical protein n=1 Tax=Thalassospira sp. TaxID=1912094 RepID=UPI0027332432|nr:hypothetical protein [Thalassospira sp.]MDP2696521.1 hypothetical protein [Thalassospira sp.]